MQDIFIEATQALPELSGDYTSTMQYISKMAASVRKTLLANESIVNVPVLSTDQAGERSMCAIDGASGQEKLQSADVLIAGATLHEALHSKPIFGQGIETADGSRKPYSGFYDIRLHTSQNDSSLSAMRAYTEIVVLGEAEHDIAIIDGAYLGNLLTVLYQLQASMPSAKLIIDKMKADGPERFIRGVRRLLDIRYQERNGKSIIALAKSDSSRAMVKRYGGASSEFFATDKMLAEYLLKPGEMLLPAPVQANEGRVSMLEKDDSGSWGGFKWSPKRSLTTEDYGILLDLFDGRENQEDLFSLYTYLYNFEAYQYFYFKPSRFNEGSNPLRVEFVVDANNSAGSQTGLADKALMLASQIDSDVTNPAIKEPYCQYLVDRDVKDPVSNALMYYRMTMAKQIQGTGIHTEGVISGYRT